MKKLSKFFAAVLSAALIISIASCKDSGSSGKEPASEPVTNAISTLKNVDGVPKVYTVEFDGEYYLDGAIDAELETAADLLAYLNKNIYYWKTAKEAGAPLTIDVQGSACSSIVAKNANSGTGGYIYGRNFDWDEGPAIIIHTMPDGGYESVSTCYVPFVSEDTNWAPTSDIENNAVSVAGIYVPMDGMNEKGLYIANLNDDIYASASKPATDDAAKKNVQTTVAIRYILDKAATVDEALNFLSSIDMIPVYADQETDTEPVYAYHFAIADNSGKSVVAEWIHGELKVTDTKIVTNFNIFNHTDNLAGNCDRFDSLATAGGAANWEMTTAQVTEALKNVQHGHSEWSAVFEPSAKRVTYYFRGTSATNDKGPIDYTKPVVVQF